MKKIILHIGRHKSGTSSIQKFLSESESLLKQNSILYPSLYRNGVAHHPLAGLLKNSQIRKLNEFELTKLINEIRAEIQEVLADDFDVVVFSSEAFQNCNPKYLYRVFSDLGCNIQVACYFRDQASYLASAYNQKVHANIYDKSLSEFKEHFGGNYMAFADSWAGFFSDFNARVFNRKYLYKQNVIDDFFLNFLNLEIPEIHEVLELKNKEQNISLSSDVLSFKLELNRRINRGEVSLEILKTEVENLYQTLAKMSMNDSSGKFVLDKKSFLDISEQFKEHNKEFSSKYLHNIPLEFNSPGKGLSALPDARFEELYQEMMNL